MEVQSLPENPNRCIDLSSLFKNGCEFTVMVWDSQFNDFSQPKIKLVQDCEIISNISSIHEQISKDNISPTQVNRSIQSEQGQNIEMDSFRQTDNEIYQ